MNKYLSIIAIFSLILLITACSNSGDKKQTKTNYVPSSMKEHGKAKNNIMFYHPPSPKVVLKAIQTDDLEFTTDLTAEPAAFKKYESKQSQALNLGIYISDLAYITIVGNQGLIQHHYIPVFALSDALRISSAFDFTADNLPKTDINILIAKSDSMVNNLTEFLLETEQEEILILMSFGLIVETMHLTVNQSGFNVENVKQSDNLKTLKTSFTNLYSFAIAHSSDEFVAEKMEVVSELNTYINDTKRIDQESVKELKTIIYKVRDNFISAD